MSTHSQICSLLVAGSISLSAGATTYYVDSAIGSNRNTGISPTAAWQSIAAVNAKTFVSGDKVLFNRGQLFAYAAPLKLKGSGVTIGSFGSGALPSIQNTDSSIWGCVADFSATNSSTLRDVAITNTTGSIREAGVCLAGTGNQVLNVDIANVGMGVSITGTGHRVSGSNIHDLTMIKNTQGGENDYGAIGVELVYASNIQIDTNRFVNLKAPSYDFGYDGSALEFYGSSNHIHFFNNTCKNVNAFTELGASTDSEVISDVSYHHNVVLNADNVAYFHVAGGDHFGVKIQNISLDNNTFVNTTTTSVREIIGFANPPAENTVFIRNNVFSIQNAVGTLVYQAGGVVHQGNVYNLSPALGNIGYSLSSNEKLGDPMFANPAGGDFHLTGASAAIDAGIDLHYALDKNGISILGVGPDAGAYEYQGQ